jgi:hypothetical protein
MFSLVLQVIALNVVQPMKRGDEFALHIQLDMVPCRLDSIVCKVGPCCPTWPVHC